ncbi:MAG: glyoxalase/bleomycin resistance/dioxygenase family protein [Alphaproteobacteria bacterium]|nr:glyoxalase/bleomycin resistance/dioxygenase family protein [Alphaproteobacteria bacterium]
MKRLHVHVKVKNIDESIRFYSTLFGNDPTVVKDDYAKWFLEDPRVNFAISPGAEKTGIHHLGIQTESEDELDELAERLEAAGEAVAHQDKANCCYALSDKAWVRDPEGVSWETFFTHGAITTYGRDRAAEPVTQPPASQAKGCGTTCCAA